MAPHPSVVAAIRAAVESSPDDVALRLHLAELLLQSGEHGEALEQFGRVLAADPVHLPALRGAASAAEALGDARAAGYRRLLQALEGPTDPSPLPPPSTRDPEGFQLPPLGLGREGRPAGGGGLGTETPRFDKPPIGLRADDDEPSGDAVEVEAPRLTLKDVGGLESVKRRLNTAFLGPMRNPELRQAFGKSLRGGLLLYGPPGCGKTYIARALAGELGARFISIGLADVLDMWLGNSEKQLRDLFDTARRNAPCVLFIDEIDALGQKRSHLKNSAGRNIVVQLLTEMDSVGANNDGVFILAATNHPWDVDTALRRPGRLDRMLLVLPPDEAARAAILEHHLMGRPAEGLDVRWLAARTGEYSGADLAHLVESAAESALEDSLQRGKARPINVNDFKQAMREVKPSTRPWFEVARNYAMFANEGGMYDDLLEHLRKMKL